MASPRLSRRRGGGIQITQGTSFILLGRDEANALVADIQNLLNDDGPAGAETVKIERHQ